MDGQPLEAGTEDRLLLGVMQGLGLLGSPLAEKKFVPSPTALLKSRSIRLSTAALTEPLPEEDEGPMGSKSQAKEKRINAAKNPKPNKAAFFLIFFERAKAISVSLKNSTQQRLLGSRKTRLSPELLKFKLPKVPQAAAGLPLRGLSLQALFSAALSIWNTRFHFHRYMELLREK